ncbi:hypothetical protein BRADI_3g40195v3 [Brachypodium distachyon]|uniref:Uncharacterized protein n=1 Tax=Brachypodium distachyon TaxID=15368 RepID=A0A2K2D289_BRADI|nr:hypothetical protein BRADI_3g40195v3 [Brachypodium distachyon]
MFLSTPWCSSTLLYFVIVCTPSTTILVCNPGIGQPAEVAQHVISTSLHRASSKQALDINHGGIGSEILLQKWILCVTILFCD